MGSLLRIAAIFFILSYHQIEPSPLVANPDFKYLLDKHYPIGDRLFGNVAGVDTFGDDNIVIFHRGSHVWDYQTFDDQGIYLQSKSEPISEDTVVTLSGKDRKIINQWGRDTFYMPHGLSFDSSGMNLWLTDVALHQVFKYSFDGSENPIILGTRFVPGNDESHFCKPTSVADTGEFVFVADGYCNSRIAMFSSEGKYLGEFGQSADASFIPTNTIPISHRMEQPTFNIPHKIIYSKEAKMLCVADRENGRIQCFSFEPKYRQTPGQSEGLILNNAIKSKFVIADPLFNGRVFSIDYSPIGGGVIVAVSGESPYDVKKPALGFVYNVTTGQLVSQFSPSGGKKFGMAHDIAVVAKDASTLYVVDITPVNIWRFERQMPILDLNSQFQSKAALTRSRESNSIFFWSIFGISMFAAVIYWCIKGEGHKVSLRSAHASGILKMLERRENRFSRIPLEDSDNMDDNSDSDVEEFNIDQASSAVKINV